MNKSPPTLFEAVNVGQIERVFVPRLHPRVTCSPNVARPRGPAGPIERRALLVSSLTKSLSLSLSKADVKLGLWLASCLQIQLLVVNLGYAPGSEVLAVVPSCENPLGI